VLFCTLYNLSEDSDQCDCSDEDDYFEGSIKHIAKIGKVKAVSRQRDTQKIVIIHLGDVEMKVEPDSGADALRLLGFANEPSGLICIIPHSRSVALLNNGSEFIFPFITMNFVSIPHVAFIK
jgi:hypothetical protein